MSISIMSQVWKMDLPSSDKMVLLALADAANDDGVTWIAVQSRRAGKLDLLTKCSLSLRAVQGAIKRLCEAGLLHREERRGKGVLYTLTPAADAPRQEMPPAGNDADPGSKCHQTFSNRHISSGAKAPSEAKPDPKGLRIPDDWTPDPGGYAFATEQGMTDEEISREADQFRDYWRAKPGAAGRKSDWAATWRNWCRNRRSGPRVAGGSRSGGYGQGPADFASIIAQRRSRAGV